MLHIVTDGGADMPENWLAEFNIHLLPLSVVFGEEKYTQGPAFPPKKFYELVKSKGIIPKSSLPSPDQIADFYRRIAKAGDTILSIHISSSMSGTYNAVRLAAQQVKREFHVVPFDSGAGSAALGFMCREASLLNRDGFSVQEIVSRLERAKQRLIVVFTLDRLDFARLSGRISNIQSRVGTILNIKPMIVLRDGLLQVAGKVFTRGKSLDWVLNFIAARMQAGQFSVAVVHADDLATAKLIAARVGEIACVKEVVLSELSIPVAANLGPGTVGVVAYPLKGE